MLLTIRGGRVLTWNHEGLGAGSRFNLTPLPFSLIGLALLRFLEASRNNACYDRW
ncbi:MAG: hypothetical protein H6740_14540 [Alphaproteobacteria bacterium]|nr:hypothetical protein [Alphaproteobacteria bacterium]